MGMGLHQTQVVENEFGRDRRHGLSRTGHVGDRSGPRRTGSERGGVLVTRTDDDHALGRESEAFGRLGAHGARDRVAGTDLGQKGRVDARGVEHLL